MFGGYIQNNNCLYITSHPTSKILFALVHGPHRFVLDSYAWLQNTSY